MGRSQNRASGSVWQEDMIAESSEINQFWFTIDSKYVTTEVKAEEDLYIASDNSGAEERKAEDVITETEQEVPYGKHFSCEDAEDEEESVIDKPAVDTASEAEEPIIKVITAVVEEDAEPEENNWLDAEYEGVVIIPDEKDFDAENAPVFAAEVVLKAEAAKASLVIPQVVPEEAAEISSAAESETDAEQEKDFLSFDRYLRIVGQGRKMLYDYLSSGPELASLSAGVRSGLCEIIADRYTECVFSGDSLYFDRVRELVETEGNDDVKNMTLHDITSELLGSIDLKEEYKRRYGDF